MKGHWRCEGAWNSMGGPNIVKENVAGFMDLSEKELLVALCVQHHIERAGDRAFHFGVKAGLRIGGKAIIENSQSIAGIELSNGGIPSHSDGSIRLDRKIRGLELAKKFSGSIVREAEIAVDEFLIEDGSAEKTPHLLLFDRFAGSRQNMAAPGKNDARNLPIQRREEGKCTLFKRENRIAAAELDVIGGSYAINVGRIDAQRLDRIIQFMRRSFRA